ncbi:group I truncated hemoglobin [Methylophaga lonarensis]|uniref:group I truncated hemoglobin n=1 Tax=Methylophaga lonarensis TaxID=999151 RepID=UPI003D27A9EB
MNKLLFATVLLVVSACSHHNSNASLYQQLGEQEGIEAIVEAFINQIGNDERIFAYFTDTHVSRFRDKLILHFCDISDGPCVYDGDNMVDIHTGMNITEGDFNHTVDLLIAAMNEVGVSHRVQNRLLARLAPLRDEMIYI